MDSYKLLKYFPSFARPSYETTIHKKDCKEYDLGVAIPYGKRSFIWCTCFQGQDIACIIEYGRNQKLQDNIHVLKISFPKEYYLGTIVSGYLLDDEELYGSQKIFLGDDIFMFKGFEFGNPFPLPLKQKMKPFIDFFSGMSNNMDFPYSIYSVTMWKLDYTNTDCIPHCIKEQISYVVKQPQYRCTTKITPHLNDILKEQGFHTDTIHETSSSNIWSKATIPIPIWNLKLNSPFYKKKCLFWVKPDIAFDVYYLYASRNVLYQCALIPDYTTSVMMNSIFRNMPENTRLDKIEESDSEDEFQNVQESKYLKIKDAILMECRFHRKFRKWVPIQQKMNAKYLAKHIPAIHDLVFLERSNTKHRYK